VQIVPDRPISYSLIVDSGASVYTLFIGEVKVKEGLLKKENMIPTERRVFVVCFQPVKPEKVAISCNCSQVLDFNNRYDKMVC